MYLSGKNSNNDYEKSLDKREQIHYALIAIITCEKRRLLQGVASIGYVLSLLILSIEKTYFSYGLMCLRIPNSPRGIKCKPMKLFIIEWHSNSGAYTEVLG